MKDNWLDIFLETGTIMSHGDGSLLIGYGERIWMDLASLSKEKPAFYFADFFLENPHAWFQHSETIEISIDDLLAQLPKSPKEFEPIKWVNPHQAIFNEAFDDLKEQFLLGELNKAVPYVYGESDSLMTEGHIIQSLRSLLVYAKKFPIYLYGFWEPGKGILGGTPEVLFKMNNRTVTTMACAGTLPKETTSDDLSKYPKEQIEHQYVVEGIYQELALYGNIKLHQQKLISLSRLAHLLTPIELELQQDVQFEQLVTALHPTPALGAYPKIPGNLWLRNYQKKVPRCYYGAPVGYAFENQACCYVAIRKVEWGSFGMRIGAGCGVVLESQKDLEWNEINLKMNMIKEMLAL